jgi:hypothetical protein
LACQAGGKETACQAGPKVLVCYCVLAYQVGSLNLNG